MASSANQESNHSLAIQRQQQELIQILAQHFQHQFYQLANSSGSGSNSIDANGANNSSATSGNGSVQQIRLPPTAQQAYQPHHAHYASEPSFVGQGGFEHMQSMNLSAATGAGAKNQSFHGHLFRSLPTTSTGPALAVNQLNTNTEPITGIDFTTHQQQTGSNSSSPYGIALINDMNLFNALGLNLTNNQLVLSLQQRQQSLIQQAASAARHYEMRNDFELEEQAAALSRIGYISNSIETNNNPNIPSGAVIEDNHNDGKRILKFSINTILGRGSPRSETDQAIKSMSQVVSPPLRDGQINKSPSNRNKNSELRSDQRGIVSSMANCDQNESCSDSSSVNNSPTPAQTNTSILFGHQTLSPQDHLNHHHSASSISGSISIGENQAADSLARGQQALRHHHNQNNHSLPFLASSTAFPWTVAARGKPRRGMMRRAVFSDSQRVGLEKRFQLQKYISKPDRKKLAEKLGLRDSQVKIWFQNRRMKWRNSKERELLSAGGSREQTLPTRNNPNPDLSDVGETIKRLTATSSIEPQVEK